MTEAVATQGLAFDFTANKALKAAAIFWFLVAATGQWLFVYFIAVHYGGTALAGDLEGFDANTIVGLAPGDTIGNLIFTAHVLLAATITAGGTLQLVPQIRARMPAFHRWNGRVFLLTGIAMAVGGLYLTWVRGATTGPVGAVSVSLNGLLIVAFGLVAWRTARARNYAAHRRWALRAFLVVNGVWFFRVGLFAWIILNGGPVGIGENFDGPFVLTLGFAQFLLPLAILELYLRAGKGQSATAKAAMAGGLFVFTLVMAVGISGAFAFMWLPYL